MEKHTTFILELMGMRRNGLSGRTCRSLEAVTVQPWNEAL